MSKHTNTQLNKRGWGQIPYSILVSIVVVLVLICRPTWRCAHCCLLPCPMLYLSHWGLCLECTGVVALVPLLHWRCCLCCAGAGALVAPMLSANCDAASNTLLYAALLLWLLPFVAVPGIVLAGPGIVDVVVFVGRHRYANRLATLNSLVGRMRHCQHIHCYWRPLPSWLPEQNRKN